MRYMTLYKPGRETTAPPTAQEMAAMGALIEEMTAAGTLIETGGLQHSSKGARVEYSGNKFMVTDGPFTETKEIVAGYAIIEAKSKEHAIQLTKHFLSVVGGGVSEVRPMHQPSDFEPTAAQPAQSAAARR